MVRLKVNLEESRVIKRFFVHRVKLEEHEVQPVFARLCDIESLLRMYLERPVTLRSGSANKVGAEYELGSTGAIGEPSSVSVSVLDRNMLNIIMYFSYDGVSSGATEFSITIIKWVQGNYWLTFSLPHCLPRAGCLSCGSGGKSSSELKSICDAKTAKVRQYVRNYGGIDETPVAQVQPVESIPVALPVEDETFK